MKTISGKVTSRDSQVIPKGALAKIYVNDNSLMDARSKKLGKVEIQDPGQFPINFKVEYDEQPVLNMIRGRYAIQVYIYQGDNLIFCTDTTYSIVDHENDTILDERDVEVKKVKQYDAQGNEVPDN